MQREIQDDAIERVEWRTRFFFCPCSYWSALWRFFFRKLKKTKRPRSFRGSRCQYVCSRTWSLSIPGFVAARSGRSDGVILLKQSYTKQTALVEFSLLRCRLAQLAHKVGLCGSARYHIFATSQPEKPSELSQMLYPDLFLVPLQFSDQLRSKKPLRRVS